jgi:hypothetical protein
MVPFISRTFFSEIANFIVLDLAFLDVLNSSNILNKILLIYTSVESFLYADTWFNLELENLNFVVDKLLGLPHDNLTMLQ